LSEQDKPTDAEEIISEFQKSKEESKKQEPESVQEPKNETVIETLDEITKEESAETTESVEPTPEPETKEEPATETTESVEPTPEPETKEEPATETTESVEPQTEQKPEESVTEAPKEEKARDERNVIFVGLKPLMTYVTATLTQLAGLPTVTIKARGRRITQAVDVSQMIVKRMNAVGFEISDVRIASDSLESQDGRMRNVSTIEIDVSRKES